ncbi:sulfite exporter TauE/SafE family protein [Oxalobacteraceae bacterium R-40]|uniref:Sulfite exporter TauE/SafE family protein n=1 Tax=Keguizhuia sedimenti TaxID=3064264 RepID=A0ABU1BNS8_9BURK|nr:sulfite exporter TauE/SafE family protein [Oxalobacteraceae bacterium R-40]
MNGLNLLPIFIVGLLGSVHCVGMCGGIVSAFSTMSSGRKPFPVPLVAQGAGTVQVSVADTALHSLAYNAGRIGSYMLAGAMAGGIAGSAYTFSKITVFQVGAYWLANLMLIVLGLYLMDAWRGLTKLETAGQALWKKIQPLTGKLMPIDSPAKMFMLGGLWGWLPCGMVYSVLLTAMMTGSAVTGASVMLAFGLGTLPMLLAIGMFGARMRTYLQNRKVRVVSGLIVLGFGVLGLVRAASGSQLGWLDMLCLPHSGGIL